MCVISSVFYNKSCVEAFTKFMAVLLFSEVSLKGKMKHEQFKVILMEGFRYYNINVRGRKTFFFLLISRRILMCNYYNLNSFIDITPRFFFYIVLSLRNSFLFG